MELEKKLQEDQYSFPYHYIPELGINKVTFVKYWGWGLQYLGRIELIYEILKKIEHNTLMDVGCGDGRLINFLAKRNEKVIYLGIDYSETAIDYAKLLNQNSKNTEFISHNITVGLNRKFDVITLIEVLEHIEPQHAPLFLSSCVEHLKKDGFFIITVPSTNLPRRKRHYQHFDKEMLVNYLKYAGLEVEQCEYIDSKGKILKYLRKIHCNRYFIVKSNFFTKILFDYYKKYHLRADRETGEGIYAVCRKL